MTAKQRLTAIKNKLTLYLSNINTSLVAKGASAVSDIGDVSGAIDTISTGVTPTGTISISQNGNYDVTDYASASVDVPNADIAEIGKGATTSYERDRPTFQSCLLPKKFEVFLPYVTTFYFLFGSSSGYLLSAWGAEEIIVHGSQDPIVTSMNAMFGRTAENSGYWGRGLPLKSVTLDFNMAGVTNFSQLFLKDARNKLIEIKGVFDFSSATNVTDMFSASMNNLTYLRFTENSLSLSLGLSGMPALDNASLVSIINGLNETVTGQTLSLHATPKATLSTIMGTVALDTTQTYHLFTADPNGTVSLLDFATQTKGWTVA